MFNEIQWRNQLVTTLEVLTMRQPIKNGLINQLMCSCWIGDSAVIGWILINQTLTGPPLHVHSSPLPFPPVHYDRLTNHGAAGSGAGGSGAGGSKTPEASAPVSISQAAAHTKMVESIRKRQYRVGLNLFNKKPERGIQYLTQKVTC